MKDYHCCATCKWYQINKDNRESPYVCSRLKYATNPKYKFNCWSPNDKVDKIIKQFIK